ncbi:MAG TPA: hypothetical protein VIK60_02700 [Vicinamibacterales bacterium]
MTNSGQPSMPLATRINHFFQHRSERERIVFEKVRQTLSLPTMLRRRAAARELMADPPFTIGTVCFVDTTQCFHFGSRVKHGVAPRLVTMIQYLTPSSFMLPRDHRAGSPYRHLATPDRSRSQRLVLGDL